MKRFLLCLLSITLAFTLFLTGCTACSGCSGDSTLYFSNSFTGQWGGSNTNPTEYYEKLTYDVSYTDNYQNGLIKKGSALQNLLNCDFTGDYTTILEVGGANLLSERANLSNLPETITDREVYKYTTTLNITATIDGKEYNDQNVTECYFFANDISFNPIYSHTLSINTYVMLSPSSQFATTRKAYEYETFYNTNNYTIIKQALELDENGLTGNVLGTSVSTNEYEFRTLIDNNQLIFALRNFQSLPNQFTVLGVVSPAYNQSKNISVLQQALYDYNTELTYNSKTSDYVIPIKRINFAVASDTYTGIAQYLCLQQAEVTDVNGNNPIKNHVLPVEYAFPISTSGTFSCLGAIVCNLKSVTIN